MSSQAFFEFSHYKTAIKEWVRIQKKTKGQGITFDRLAKACLVQKTYLSRVLNQKNVKAHLSADQIFLAAEYLGLTQEQSRYLQLLFERDRTSVSKRRDQIDRQIAQFKKNRLKTDRNLIQKEIILESENSLKTYFLDPLLQLTHLFLTIPEFSQNPQKIAPYLGISKKKLEVLLKELKKNGLVGFEGGKVTILKNNLHLSTDSPLLGPYRTLLKLKGLERIQSLNPGEFTSFSALFSCTPEVKEKIGKEFMELLKKAQSWVSQSEPTVVYQMGIDLFPWMEEVGIKSKV